VKKLMGNAPGSQNQMLGKASIFTGGYVDGLVNSMNAFFVSVTEDLPGLQFSHLNVYTKEPLPA